MAPRIALSARREESRHAMHAKPTSPESPWDLTVGAVLSPAPEQRTDSRRVRIYPWMLPVVLVVLAGCGSSSPRDLDLSDDPVWIPTLRAAWTLSEAGQGEESEASDARVEFALEGDVSGAYGSDKLYLNAGEALTLNGTLFTGPANVQSDFDLWVVGATVRVGARFSGVISAVTILGVEADYFRIEIDGAGEHATETIFSLGPRAGLRLAGHPTKWLDLQVEGTMCYGVSSHWGTGRRGAEFAAIVRPWPSVGFLAGWRWWQYNANAYDPDYVGGYDESDVEVKLSGPVVGLQVDF